MTVGGLSLLIALGVVGLLLIKDRKWFPLPIAHVLGLGDIYPTQGLIGPQKIIHDWDSVSRPSRAEDQKQGRESED
jgi:hypothetical protein